MSLDGYKVNDSNQCIYSKFDDNLHHDYKLWELGERLSWGL